MSTVLKKDMFMEWKDVVYDGETDPEFTRIEAIVTPVLSDLDDDAEIGYHFQECDGHNDEHFDELMKDLHHKTEWHTIYDSCYFPVSDGGSYSVIRVAYSENADYFYLSVALMGCQGAGALTEYFKVPMTGKWCWSA